MSESLGATQVLDIEADQAQSSHLSHYSYMFKLGATLIFFLLDFFLGYTELLFIGLFANCDLKKAHDLHQRSIVIQNQLITSFADIAYVFIVLISIVFTGTLFLLLTIGISYKYFIYKAIYLGTSETKAEERQSSFSAGLNKTSTE